jgi:HlyD family type I secretion membrane fusion protein
VQAGQVLMRLDLTQARANFTARRDEWLRLQAIRARYESYNQNLDQMRIPQILLDEKSEEFIAFLANERQLFESRKKELSEREEIYAQQIKQVQAEITGKNMERAGLEKMLEIIAEEISDKNAMLDKKLVRKPDVLALRRNEADLTARIGSNIADVSRAEQKIKEIQTALSTLRTKYYSENAEQIMKTTRDIAQIEGALTNTGDILARTDVVAPVAGTVLQVRFKTIGGVIKAGEPILDVVPDDDDLVIDAKLSPSDIDVVRVGLPAEVHFDSYVSRRTPMFEGVVTHVSSDAIVDQSAASSLQQRYFQVKVKVDRKQIEKYKHVVLVPGMPAEAYILTGEQTVLDYIIAPLATSFRKAFREDYN